MDTAQNKMRYIRSVSDYQHCQLRNLYVYHRTGDNSCLMMMLHRQLTNRCVSTLDHCL